MNRLFKYFVLSVVITLLGVLAISVAAQDGLADPGPGEGGVIVVSNFGSSDPSTFNPIIGSDTTSSAIYGRMYPSIYALDPRTFVPTPNIEDGLAESWEYDETGTVLTMYLRQDMFWSDGEQITADDYIYAVNAVRSGATTSPRTSAFYQLDDGTLAGGSIHEVTKIDDFTIEFLLGAVETDENGEDVLNEDGSLSLLPACDAFGDLNDIAVVPEHTFSAAFGDDYASMDADPYFYGDASFGAFDDPFIEFGVQVSLLANQNYSDTKGLDYVAPSEWIMQAVADQNVGYERFLAGDFTTLGIPAANQNEFRTLADESGDFQYIEFPANGYTYVGLNLADPTNPQPALDENGDYVDQGMHPIFGDVRVRQAFAHGVNTAEMIGTRGDDENPATGILEGNGYPIATHDHPVFSETVDLLEEAGIVPRAYDPELAMSLLEEAGWVDTDGDGIRNCQGCLYATEVDPEFEGSDLTFTLLTNSGNVARESTGETIRSQLAEIGFNVDFQSIEFGTLVDNLLGQQFDALIIGWNLGLPFLPGSSLSGLFGAEVDQPGSGFNYTSYANPEFNAILKEMASLPGCDPETRNAAYAEAQAMLYEDAPYIFLYAGNVMSAAQGTVQNWDPIPNNTTWNESDWVTIAP